MYSLLSESRDIKLSLLYFFYQNQNELILSKELVKELKVSERKIIRYIRELNDEISEIIQVHSLISKVSSGTYRLESQQVIDLSDIYEQIKYLYFEESLPFRLCQYLALNCETTLNDICENLAVSKSYAYHILQELNEELKSFGISVGINDEKKVTFIGRELNIRLYLYNFFTMYVPCKLWLFPIEKSTIYSKLGKIMETSNISHYTLSNLLTLCGIIHTRLSNGFFLNRSRFLELKRGVLCFKMDSMSCDDWFYSYSDNDELIEDEELLFSFFIQILFNDLISEKDLSKIVENILKEESIGLNFIKRSIQIFTNLFQINVDNKQYNELVYYYSLFFLVSYATDEIDLLDIWHLNTFTKSEIKQYNKNIKIEKDLLIKVDKIYHSLSEEVEFQSIKEFLLHKCNIQYFVSITYIQFTMFKLPSVSIFLNFTNDYITKKFIQEKLSQIYCSNTIQFTEKLNADIIITDNPHHEENSSTIVLVRDTFDSKQFLLILSAVNNEIIRYS